MILKAINDKILFMTLEKAKFGQIKLVILEPYSEHVFGEGNLISEVTVKNINTIRSVISGGDVALAKAIVNEDVSITNEAAFIEWACKNDDMLRDAFYGRFIATILPRIKKIFRRNTVSGARRNIIEHYDLGNSFYSKWLDKTMTYSSAIFLNQDNQEDLTTAQLRKYDRIIDELGITSNDRVLEVGCGWGGFFTRAVQRTGCHVTAVMNSPAQADYNRKLIKEKNLEANVDLQQIDYRSIEGSFDKIVSIEMIEAVGQKYWPTYFSKLSSVLRPGGSALIQGITIRENRFNEYSKNPDFISTMIFPGGMLLTNEAIFEHAKQSGLKVSEKPFEFGLSYAETLSHWRANFLNVWGAGMLPEFDQKFRNLWRFYLSYCEGAFRAERINVGHFVFEK